MKTRSTGTVDSGLRRKTIRVPSNRELDQLSKRVAARPTLGTEVVKTPNDKERKIRTPKSKRKSITPRRDDLICSQHFDSQVVVGWDCHSPDSLRDLKKCNEQPDDVTIPKRNTPPLLGMWRDSERDECQRMETNAFMPNRLKKRGRTRRKSAKDSVSQALLQKLEKALDKCSETNKETEPRNAEGELFPSDCDEEVEAEEEEEEEMTIANTSEDLFDNLTNFVNVLKDTRGKPKVEARQDADWSDEELFEDDSFMVKPTQLSLETKKSQVFGLKRKSVRDSDLPQSKCVRVSDRQAVGRLDQRVSQSTSTVTTASSRFTAINARPSVFSCDAKASNVIVSAHTRAKQFQTKSAPSSTVVSSSFASGGGVSRVVTLQSTGYKVQNSVSSATVQPSSSFYSKNKMPTYVTQSKPTSVMNSSVLRKDSGYKNSGMSTSCQTGLKSNNTPGAVGSLQTVNQSTQNRASAFKKHSSFSGTESISQSLTSTRKRSISGNSNTAVWSSSASTSNVPKAGTSQTVQHFNSSSHGQAKTSFTPYYQTSNVKPQTVTPLSANGQKLIGNSKNTFRSRENGPRPSSSAFDTSISDDLLCQLAEPDDILDTQVELAKPSNQSSMSIGVGGSAYVTSTVCSRNTYCANTSAMQNVSHINSKVAKNNSGQVGPSNTGQSKQYRFRDSQKLGTTTTKSPPQPPVNVLKAADKAEVRWSQNRGVNAVGVRMETVEEELQDELGDDDFGDEFSDDDGLTEPQILALLDEAELLATQQFASQRSNQEPLKNSQGQISNSQGHTSNSQGQTSNSQGHTSNSQGHTSNSQGHTSNSQGHTSNSQGHTSNSQGQSSQGQVSASQAKYTAEEIERKKKEAIQKRKMKSQLRNTQGF